MNDRYLKNVKIQSDYEKISVYWKDPSSPDWKGTKVIKKENSQPADENDGEMIVDNKVKDKYSTTPFVDKDVLQKVKYYYKIIPYYE